jgi:hypothetical protein
LSHPSATTCNHGQRDSAYQLNATGNQSGCRPPQTSPCCRSAAPKRQPHAQEQRPSPEPIWCLSWIALDPDMWHDRGTPWGGVGNECRENHWPRGPTMRIPSQSTRNPGWRFSPPCCPARPSVLPSETLRVAQRDLVQIRFSWRSTTCWTRTTRPGRTPRPSRRTTTSIGRSNPWMASPPTHSRVAMRIPLRLLCSPRSIHLGNLSA